MISSNHNSEFIDISKSKIKIFIMILLFTCCLTQNEQYLQKQYLSDIDRLATKINSFQFKSQDVIKVKQIQNNSKGVQKTIQFEPQIISLQQNQIVQFSYPNIGDNLIDIKVRQVQLKEADLQKYTSAKQNYHKNPQKFIKNQFGSNSCRINDPQIQIQKIRAVIYNDIGIGNGQRQHVLYLNQKGQYRVLFYNVDYSLEVYTIYFDDTKHDVRAEINLHITLNSNKIDQLYQNHNITGNDILAHPVFLFKYQQKILLFNRQNLYEIKDNIDTLEIIRYGQIQSNTTTIEGDLNYQHPLKVIPLKYGLLFQYHNYFQVYTQKHLNPQNNTSNSSTSIKKIFQPKFSKEQIYQIIKNSKIVDIQISQQLSHHSGYKIFVLVQNLGVVELQFGSYTSINIYQIPYGEKFHKLAVGDDILEIIFSLTKSKMLFYYVMEIVIDRKQNPRIPLVYVNRFYDDLKSVKRIEFINGDLNLIGQSDVLMFDYPVSSKVLIKENITQYPYHYAMDKLQKIHYLDRYSSKDVSYLFLVKQNYIALVSLVKKPQTIKCIGKQSFDARIQFLKQCDQNGQIQNVCKYIANLRVIVNDQQAQSLKSLKSYLIMGLIVAILISLCIIFKQIFKNTATIQKLNKLKEKINKKYNQLDTKGKKISGSDKFQQLNEQNGFDNLQMKNKFSAQMGTLQLKQ